MAAAEQRTVDPTVFCETIARRWAGAYLHGTLVEQHGMLQFTAYFAWRRDERDRVTPCGGLRLRPRDLARTGRMLLDGGPWQARQVVPAA